MLASLAFLLIAIVSKILRQRNEMKILHKLLLSIPQNFIVWVVSILLCIFSWCLADSVYWLLYEKILIMAIIVCETLLIVMSMRSSAVCRMEFVSYELILIAAALFLSVRTVFYILRDDKAENS